MNLEYRESLERTINLATGETDVAVRIEYRRPPTRHWSSFLLFVDDPSADLPDEVVEQAIFEHERGPR